MPQFKEKEKAEILRAVREQDLEALNEMIHEGNVDLQINVGKTALMCAAKIGSLKCV